MAKQVMTRKASDNVYLHKDFHGALSVAIDYLHQHYGADAVRDLLRQFAVCYYAPLKADLNRRGLPALREYLEKIYGLERGTIGVSCSENELRLEVQACPAVQHMRQHDYHVAKLFYETTKTVNEAICDGSPFSAELVSYDEQTGRSIQHFFRRRP